MEGKPLLLLRRAPTGPRTPTDEKSEKVRPDSASTKALMFSTMPSTGTPTRSNILAPRRASPTATSCGVVTISAAATCVDCTSESCALPVPGGKSTRK